jgi:hypothetical protein
LVFAEHLQKEKKPSGACPEGFFHKKLPINTVAALRLGKSSGAPVLTKISGAGECLELVQ